LDECGTGGGFPDVPGEVGFELTERLGGGGAGGVFFAVAGSDCWPVVVRRAAGFLGTGGVCLVLAVEDFLLDAGLAVSFVTCLGSSSLKSMSFSSFVAWVELRGGSDGRFRLSSSSISLSEAAIAALISASSSSEGL
jgi:hypothetical protein